MKAITIDRHGDAGVLTCSDVDKPAPGPGELLIRVAICGAGYGDVMVRNGDYPGAPAFPITLGFEASGTVQATGDGVPEKWLGQRVMVAAPNCNAEYLTCPVPFVAALPDSVSDEAAAAAATNYATAHLLLPDAGTADPNSTLLVYAAAGGVGSAMVQLGKLAGFRVIGLTSTEEKCRFVKEQGADVAVNHTTDDVADAIRTFTEGRGADLIMNSVAGDTLARDFQVVAPFGRIVLLGMSAGPPAPEAMGHFLAAFGSSIALKLFSLSTVAALRPEAVHDTLEKLAALLAEGKIAPPIHDVLPLSDAAAAHRMIESGSVMGKVLLKP